ncbi:MAG: uroporphyrinogen-III synthase [Candidatus Dormibacteria bacterium]
MRAAGTLQDRRILVTRARDQALELADLLLERGAIAVTVPVMRLRLLLAPAELERWRAQILAGEWQDLIFTSANSVSLVLPPAPVGEAPRPRVFAIGPGTASAVAARGWQPQALPQNFVAESLAARVLTEGIAGRRVLLPRARGARAVLPELLERAGARLELLEVYEMEPEWDSSGALREALRAGEGLDCLVFTSGSSVDCFEKLRQGAPVPEGALVACIGPVTAESARRAGLGPGLVAAQHSLPGLLSALESQLGPKPQNEPADELS